jgi:hypothetical protein
MSRGGWSRKSSRRFPEAQAESAATPCPALQMAGFVGGCLRTSYASCTSGSRQLTVLRQVWLPDVQSSPNRRNACLIAATFSGGHGFSAGAVPGATRPNCSLQCRSHALSGTKPCWREIHFWISWSVARWVGCCWPELRGEYSRLRSSLRVLIRLFFRMDQTECTNSSGSPRPMLPCGLRL